MKYTWILIIAMFALGSCNESEKSTLSETQVEKTEMETLLSKYTTFKLETDISMLSSNQKKMIPILIDAAEMMNELFWYESYGDKNELLSSIKDEDTKKFVEINYGPLDRLNGNKNR